MNHNFLHNNTTNETLLSEARRRRLTGSDSEIGMNPFPMFERMPKNDEWWIGVDVLSDSVGTALALFGSGRISDMLNNIQLLL